jgi:hypothetical protein
MAALLPGLEESKRHSPDESDRDFCKRLAEDPKAVLGEWQLHP